MNEAIQKHLHSELQFFINQNVEPIEIQKGINLNELELSSTDLESIAMIYDKIRQVFKQYIIYKYL